MSERTTSASWAMGIVRSLELDGLDCRVLFKELGLDYSDLDNPDARFPQDSLTRLWQRAVALSGNPAIGLNMAKVVRPGSFSVAGYALMSSQTLKDGFSRLVRYQRIIAESADLSFRLLAEGYALILTVHGDHLPPTRQSAEASMASVLAFCSWLTGRTLQPRQVLIQGDPPKNMEPYKQAFHAPMTFNAPYDALVFDRADMDAPLPTANEAMAQLHDRFAGEYLARFSESRVTHQARQVLCRLLPQGEPKREMVAQRLHLSQRTLQRRLQEEGTSFQTLLDDTRRELAEQYLAQPQMTLLEIAYLLGFADPSNFFRAFRRWFDATPGEYRARI
ncbi:AraC family transcriptional regulator [Pseudomonas sp. CCI3.2]|uniref:AraC family transcriptional regulator n=1 Tax=unclassified Pseudomonas TaxID=196821 RepID=UPI002AC97122|nr:MULTISPECIES: AraC family transcriptional regulator [unclassified Pseudomonas]MEB0079111.1 AraC family transcriptional regulator [Pseudomonas sp. MH10out]MEB0092082.1 AraC family transcriptional regulator [Pseudomonas sp. CCI4.2]MEB0100493.1 AraC family transcriptional regulator [Pseudomonas sp. CCI3.2]MEB0132361.1 AraC family transcriptional regulator [Pseudomonas sp. CCI2.4]MEB0158724.1 AraC family transcriptional regulator [Pseudomonas sp. AH2 (2023)]